MKTLMKSLGAPEAAATAYTNTVRYDGACIDSNTVPFYGDSDMQKAWAIDGGLVDEDEGGLFTLVDGWSERVAELDAIVPTAGTMARRALAAADSRLRYCTKAEETTVDHTERESLRRRKERAVAQKWALLQVEVIAYNERALAAGLTGVTMEQAVKPGRGETFADWQRRQVMGAQIDELTIREFAKTLAGLDKATAERTAYYADWSAYEFAQAWALRAIV